MSETPIFDQLARELGYSRMVAGGPTLRLRPSAFRAVRKTDKSTNTAPASVTEEDTIIFKKPIPVTTLAELAKGIQQE